MKNEGDELETPLTWLTVGGCPRSGTTALGAALNGSGDIALLHEYPAKQFFDALDGLFLEEDRQRALGGTDFFGNLLLRREKTAKNIAQAIYRDVFGKDARFIGTKTPNNHLLPEPTFPDWVSQRIIHVTRNPFNTVSSSILKDKCGYDANVQAPKALSEIESLVSGKTAVAIARDVEERLSWWIGAWNYAVARADDPHFLHVFYEDLLARPSEEKERVIAFLGGAEDLSFSNFRSSNNCSGVDGFIASGLGEHLPLMASIVPGSDWLTFARDKFESRERFGFPIKAGEVFDFSSGGNSWKLPTYGFYSPERDGQWIQGEKATIHFSPCFSCEDCLLTVEIPWALDIHGIPPIIEIELNGFTHIQAVSLDERNGRLNRFHWVLRALSIKAGQQLTLNLRALNPRNPLRLGVGQDDRELSVMIRSLRFDPI